MKDYLGCLIPIVILIGIGTIAGLYNRLKNEKKEIQETEIAELREKRENERLEEMISIKQGQNGKYVELYNQILPCFDLFAQQDSVKIKEIRELPIAIYTYNLSDTICVDTGYNLREAAIIFQSDEKCDTLDFCYNHFHEGYDIFLGDYYIDSSITSIAWDDVTGVTFVFRLSKDSDRIKFALSRKEFAHYFPDIIPHIIQRKLRKM